MGIVLPHELVVLAAIILLIAWFFLVVAAQHRMQHHTTLSDSKRLMWTLAVLLLPVFGALAYVLNYPERLENRPPNGR
jgi:uncharacterized membrane protein YozB (DUF420 family)